MSTAEYDRTEEIRDRSGEIVAGHYRLDTIIGRGGMGYVYRARNLELDEPVVLKFIDPAIAQDPVARARFRREAKALVRLRHPGIVTMREFGTHEGSLFLVMELLEGQTLGARLASRSGALPMDEAYEIFHQLGEVLETVHAAGVVHRDLKPDNVMLVPNRVPSTPQSERAVLMDFGVARLGQNREAGVSVTGSVLGTPSFMSPEQCAGKESGPESDIYALGVMLFQMLSGRLPFASDMPTVVMSHHMFVPPPKLTVAAAGQSLPLGLTKLLEDLLSKNPERRPSARQFLERLVEIRSGLDPLSVGAAAADQRFADALKSRDERAIAVSGASADPSSDQAIARQPTLPGSDLRADAPTVLVHGFAPERTNYLLASLAVNGIAVVQGDPTSAGLGPNETLAIAIVAGTGSVPAAETLRNLRQQPGYANLPVLVVDVREANEIADLIRAGANDVALSILGDDALVAKAWRLIRRRR
jgi:serine/threonine-protein kinase